MNEDYYIGFLYGAVFGFVVGVSASAAIIVVFKALNWVFA